ncbi:uncharacterized protein LOC120859682, partial [Oryx dammah]
MRGFYSIRGYRAACCHENQRRKSRARLRPRALLPTRTSPGSPAHPRGTKCAGASLGGGAQDEAALHFTYRAHSTFSQRCLKLRFPEPIQALLSGGVSGSGDWIRPGHTEAGLVTMEEIGILVEKAQDEIPALSVSRPQTGLSFLGPEPEDLEDLYSRYKKLQQELEFLEVQEEYIKDEQKNLKKEFLHAQEEVKRIQSIPLVIGQFLEAVDQNTAIVGSTT